MRENPALEARRGVALDRVVAEQVERGGVGEREDRRRGEADGLRGDALDRRRDKIAGGDCLKSVVERINLLTDNKL